MMATVHACIKPVARNSMDHIARVREIDTKYNDMRSSALRDFKENHTGVDFETSDEWLIEEAEIEAERQVMLARLRGQLFDA